MGSFLGTNPQTVSSSLTNPNVTAQQNQIYGLVDQYANQFSGNPAATVAPFDATQQAATTGLGNFATAAAPFTAAGEQLIGQGSNIAGQAQPAYQQNANALGQVSPIGATPYNPSAYLSPYTQNVVNTTQQAFQNQNAVDQNNFAAYAAKNGNLFGGDRAGIGSAQLTNQEQLAQAPVIANLENTGFQNAQNANLGQQQYGLNLGATNNQTLLNQASGYGTLGSGLTQAGLAQGTLGQQLGSTANAGQNTAVTGLNSLLSAGTQQQQTQQAQLSSPFTLASWMGNASPGTAATPTSTTYPGANPASSIAGLGLAGAAAFSLLKDGGRVGLAGGGGVGPDLLDEPTPNVSPAHMDFADKVAHAFQKFRAMRKAPGFAFGGESEPEREHLYPGGDPNALGISPSFPYSDTGSDAGGDSGSNGDGGAGPPDNAHDHDSDDPGANDNARQLGSLVKMLQKPPSNNPTTAPTWNGANNNSPLSNPLVTQALNLSKLVNNSPWAANQDTIENNRGMMAAGAGPEWSTTTSPADTFGAGDMALMGGYALGGMPREHHADIGQVGNDDWQATVMPETEKFDTPTSELGMPYGPMDDSYHPTEEQRHVTATHSPNYDSNVGSTDVPAPRRVGRLEPTASNDNPDAGPAPAPRSRGANPAQTDVFGNSVGPNSWRNVLAGLAGAMSPGRDKFGLQISGMQRAGAGITSALGQYQNDMDTQRKAAQFQADLTGEFNGANGPVKTMKGQLFPHELQIERIKAEQAAEQQERDRRLFANPYGDNTAPAGAAAKIPQSAYAPASAIPSMVGQAGQPGQQQPQTITNPAAAGRSAAVPGSANAPQTSQGDASFYTPQDQQTAMAMLARDKRLVQNMIMNNHGKEAETLIQRITEMEKMGKYPIPGKGFVPLPGFAESDARAAGMKTLAEKQSSAPYDILHGIASQSGRTTAMHPNEVYATGAQINPQIDAAAKWATQQIPGLAQAGPQQAAPQTTTAAPAQGQGAMPSPPIAQPQPAQSATPAQPQNIFPTGVKRNPDGTMQTNLTGEHTNIMTEAGKEYLESQKNYRSSVDVKMRLASMEDKLREINTNDPAMLTSGTGAAMRFNIAKALNSTADALGLPPDRRIDPQKIADWESLQKDATNLGFALSRTLGAREAASVVDQAVAAVPSIGNSPKGAMLVLNGLRQGAQRNIDFFEYQQQFLKDRNTTVGADIEFNKTHPAALYAERAKAMAVYNIPNGLVEALQQPEQDPARMQAKIQAFNAAIKAKNPNADDRLADLFVGSR